MFIMTERGWQRLPCNAIPAPADPKPHNLVGYKEAGYQSYLGWIHKDPTMVDPNQGF